ncbi:hypothetical protein [Jeotgalibaca porci]|uniref:hypothetical protein n=1 Tax=Jeotgalibaca porci TaxID=1868793 RepID=UPI00359F791E
MEKTKEEIFYWFETRSGKMPADFEVSRQFRWFGMKRDVQPSEVDSMRIIFLLYGTYEEFNTYLLKKGELLSGI